MTDRQRQMGTAFQRLHDGPGCFIMPNPPDAGSAILLAHIGFKALGTTSAGIAFQMGRADKLGALSNTEALAEMQRIVEASPVPVSADLEGGLGHSLDDIHATYVQAIDIGLGGGSIEDTSDDPSRALLEPEEAAERVAAARAAIDATGQPFVLTARAECYLSGHPEPFKESMKRIHLYREAGADCLYVPGIADPDEIRELVKEAGRPVNILARLGADPLTFDDLRDMGVRRISVGSGLGRHAFKAYERAAKAMLEEGRFDFMDDTLSVGELNQLFD
jgi:2-methylisocitrate lyase-like PEP mutase family enzyme